MRKILLRFDDICPMMNWAQWEKAKKMLDAKGVTALLGVVPNCKDPELQIDEARPDFWEYIKELQKQGYAIAMHGYHHQFEIKADGLVTRNKISEFAGLPYEKQLEKIRKGKDIFTKHGIEVNTFFAPAHSYDDNTLRALAVCGFKYVSDGLSSKPYLRQGIKLLPCRSGGIPRIEKKSGYITAVVHAHEWDRKDTGIEKSRFIDLFENYNSEIVSFNEYKQQKEGIGWCERLIEKCCLYLKLYLAPRLIHIIRR